MGGVCVLMAGLCSKDSRSDLLRPVSSPFSELPIGHRKWEAGVGSATSE